MELRPTFSVSSITHLPVRPKYFTKVVNVSNDVAFMCVCVLSEMYSLYTMFAATLRVPNRRDSSSRNTFSNYGKHPRQKCSHTAPILGTTPKIVKKAGRNVAQPSTNVSTKRNENRSDAVLP